MPLLIAFLKFNYTHDLYFCCLLSPAFSLCVLQNLLIKPALRELLTLVHQLEQPQVLLWVHAPRQDVLVQAHLCQQLAPTVRGPQAADTEQMETQHEAQTSRPTGEVRLVGAYLSLSMSLTFRLARHCLTIIKRVEALEGVRPAENRSARGRRRTRHRLSLGGCGGATPRVRGDDEPAGLTSLLRLTLFFEVRVLRRVDVTKDSQLSCRTDAHQSCSLHHRLSQLYHADRPENRSAEFFSTNLEKQPRFCTLCSSSMSQAICQRTLKAL